MLIFELVRYIGILYSIVLEVKVGIFRELLFILYYIMAMQIIYYYDKYIIYALHIIYRLDR